MAKILDKDPVSYIKEKEGFLRDLRNFHESKGTPFRRVPTINGHEVDLYLLYSLVAAEGGWIQVNVNEEWPDLLEKLNLPSNCINAAAGLKHIYLRFLDRWEKAHRSGALLDSRLEEEDDRHYRWSGKQTRHHVPVSYNYQQHNIAESTRDYNNLSTDLYKQSDYDRLALSLISSLPNEQDFAINVCTLLSNDGKHTLKLEKYPRLVDYLIAHTGVYHHSSLRPLFTGYYHNIRRQPLNNFWKISVQYREFLDLTNEINFMQIVRESAEANKDSSVPEVLNDIKCVVDDSVGLVIGSQETNLNRLNGVNIISDSESDCERDSDDELFNLGCNLGTQDYIGQRVLQIATILRNLSFIEENVTFLAKNKTFVRFLILCSSVRWGGLHNMGLDMLGNIAGEFLIKDLQSDRLSFCLLKLLSHGLQSEDRTCCIASLDALNKLSQIESNEDVLTKTLEPLVYQRVCSFLTLHDVMLLVYTLECLYSLTSLGERPCNLIVNIHGVVDTLVSLVTVEGKSYGPKACIGMKLVETVPGNSVNVTTQAATVTTSTPASIAAVSTNTTTSTAITTLSSVSTIQVTPTKPLIPVNATKATPITPQRIIITPSSSTIVTTTPPTVTTTQQLTQVITSQQLVQQQHAHQQVIQENEQFALAWLRATYEPLNNSRVEQQELYKHYINSCAKIGRRGVIAPLHFPRCVRSVFGGMVGPNPVKSTNPNDAQYYEGIKVRNQPLVISVQSVSNLSTTQSLIKGGIRRKGQNAPTSTVLNQTPVPVSNFVPDSTDTPPPSPASPILKAQLSAPSKPRESTVITSPTYKGDMKSQVMAHPHLSQALLGNTTNSSTTSAGPSKEPQTGQSNTSLIKSLLATKVNDCMTTISMKNSTDCQSVVQVAARQQQQKLLAQQTTNSKTYSTATKILDNVSKVSRMNGARQLFTDDVMDSSVTSTATMGSNFSTTKREPPQPPPPPLAPLSNSSRITTLKMENDDSNSTGNNSLASSSGINIGISSTEDGENSLTSFEGLLNGVPNMDNTLALNDDSNSKDSQTSSGIISKTKTLRLADLLEKKIDNKEPPVLNGMLGKELRIGEKGLELVENHIEKALSKEPAKNNIEHIEKQGVKRPSTEEVCDVENKKLHLTSTSSVNGCVTADSPAPDSVSSSSNDEPTGTVSTAAAKLFADIAADILEDEEEEMMQEQQQQSVEESNVVQMMHNNAASQQIFMDQSQSQMIVTQPRQILLSQPGLQTTNQVVLPPGTQLKPGQTVIVQNTGQQRAPMVLQQSNTGQFLLSQGIQGQMQLTASTTQPGQYVLQTSSTQGAYVVAQPQTAMVHGQPQTVLVAQTAQQQGTNMKTIIILQQPSAGNATHHQKLMVTPQGQQVMVTQMPRPILQTATSINNVLPTSTIIKATANTNMAQTIIAASEKKVEEPKPVPKVKIVRDVSTPFVCEWGECQIDTKFKSANQVYMHVCAVHCPESIDELTCQWERCDNMKRKRFSLMTHIYDKHCNLEAMKQSQVKRKQQSQSGKVETLTPTPATPHPGYAPDAALHAIKRHALEFVNPKELQDDNEGPVTKSMRLTAALILRNLVIYSNNCKRYLRQYETHLANVALSNVESSRTVAQILYDMSDASVNHR